MSAKKPIRKAAPRKAAPRSTSAVARIKELEAQVKQLAWEHEKFKYEVQMSFASMLLQNPQVQQALAQQMVQGGMRNGR